MQRHNSHSEELKRYLRGDMTHEEAHAFERKSLEDPFLQEALEGAEQIDAETFQADVAGIEERINRSEPRKAPMWRWAAVIALLIASGFMGWWVLNETRQSTEKSEVTQRLEEPEETEKAESPESKDTAKNAQAEDEPAEKSEPTAEDSGTSASQNSEKVHQRRKQKELTVARSKLEEETTFNEQDEAMAFQQADDETFGQSGPPEEADSNEWQQNAFIEPDNPVLEERARESQAFGAAAKKSKKISSLNTLSGIVTDADGQPLPGVNVVEKGTTRGVITDMQGEFTIQVAPESVLSFTSVGMKKQDVAVDQQQHIEVSLQEDTQALAEVVVTNNARQTESVSEEAVPEGGMDAYKQYLEEALEAQSGGKKIVIKIDISETGEISQVEVVRSPGEQCTKAIRKALKDGPQWNAAKKGDEPVESQIRIKVKCGLK